MRIRHAQLTKLALVHRTRAWFAVDLTRPGIEVEARLEPANRTQIDGQEVEEERAFLLGRERDQLAARLRVHLPVDVLEVRRLAAQPRTIVHELAVDLAARVVDHRHRPYPLTPRRGGRSRSR